jgi:glycosyltransferase involved in cell wall biosynthesis
MGNGETIGIVVIGRNEAAHLPACLKSLAPYSNRIVYADSASTDGSPLIASEMGASVVHIDPSAPLTPARGRNEGFKLILRTLPECEFVQFVDGDSVVESGWIEAASSFLKENIRAAVVCGHVLEAHPHRSVYNWLCGDEWKGAIGPIDACGGNAMIRVAALREVGDFRPDLVAGEEAELMARMRGRGWEIWRLDLPMVTHDADILDFGDWWRRNKRGGYAAANVWWITKGTDEPLYGAQLRSPLLWVLVWPLLVALLSAILSQPAIFILLPAGWILQITRTATKRGLWTLDAWRYATMIMFARLPETIGILSFVRKRVLP